jgi:hypothetical protein
MPSNGRPLEEEDSLLQVTGLSVTTLINWIIILMLQTGILKITNLRSSAFKPLYVHKNTRIRI